MSPTTKIGKHPAIFSRAVLDAMRPILADESQRRGHMRMVDPFGGVGKAFQLETDLVHFTVIEIETGWDDMNPRVQQGNALHLDYPDRYFTGWLSSCTYANRMADHHNAQERCKACKGKGDIEVDAQTFYRYTGPGVAGGIALDGVTYHFIPCAKCGGTGRRSYARNTYKHRLGRDLHPDNSGAMQWGDDYREFHIAAWKEAGRVVDDLCILNVSDHIRKHTVIPVAAWHRDTLISQGWTLADNLEVATPRNKFGANREARVEVEHIFTFRR